ncbi:hypothetical protein GGQ88_000129 [Novosphingobium hassiacum]|uniref:Uncharacterized protein n=1 Tax=Novosphingobium hassiacum TaxID=173676 RepID=A0A7W6EUN0_9SPHN|nr:hypothetical protein [Novosphingobium hassiacum]MBB3858889.1 hypothetical protein [Novosphingobium hassiacum]
MIELLGSVYLLGLVVCLVTAGRMAAHEPTSHGQSIIIPLGCAFAFFWPIALVYFALVGLVLGIRKLFR